MNCSDRIVIDPEVQHGKPVIRGSRLPVARILGGLAGGMSFEDLQREYDVTAEDIRAAIRYAGQLVLSSAGGGRPQTAGPAGDRIGGPHPASSGVTPAA
jgi:uncharacterized protein (DUF433 family)